MSSATLALACVTTLKVLLMGQINSLTQIEAARSTVFSNPLPNDGFLLGPKPAVWEMSIMFKKPGTGALRSNGGIVWFTEEGTPRWYKGQQVTVQITACPGPDNLPTLLKQWGAYEYVN
jgi:hypothetical protein